MPHPASLIAVGLMVAGLLTPLWRRIPMVGGIALANLLVFLVTIATGSHGSIAGSPLLDDLATRIDYLTLDQWARWPTILTASFLHSGVAHLLSNVFVFVMIGMPFEERVGRARFLAIYLFGAVSAVLLHALWTLGTAPQNVDIPLVGASGAVFGILGAFATLYPRDRIPMYLVVIMLPRVPVLVGALVLSAIEFLFLFGDTSRVARAAHLGGVVGGAIGAFLLRPKVPLNERRPEALNVEPDKLEQLAKTPQQRDILKRLRESHDQPEVQKAWLERYAATVSCTQCGSALEARGATVRCPNGHPVTYGA